MVKMAGSRFVKEGGGERAHLDWEIKQSTSPPSSHLMTKIDHFLS
jgi:hypothetical protein